MTEQDQIRIREKFLCPAAAGMEITISEGPGLHILFRDQKAAITAEDANALARACFLLSCAVREGKAALEVHQHRHIASCGAMIDASRNAVPTVEAVKRMMDKLAMLGMNLLMLYTEDTYEVPGQPYFGYLRGRYSRTELRELDDYAYSLGIELVPCIQTLGHMEQFLQWSGNYALRDQNDILLIDQPETYRLIEDAIAGLRSCLRAGRVHIGMDEAHGVGLGAYHAAHGEVDRFALLSRHLQKVCAICEKYDLHPMMWSDMFFRLGSKQNAYYDPEIVIPDEVIRMIPNVDMVYWDYYHNDQSFYDHMLEQHARMGRTAFAGGVWAWSGFLPHVKKTRSTMPPALRACAAHRVDTVFATLWGDDGAETNALLAFNQLPIFSEACWQGENVPEEEIARLGEQLTGVPDAAFRAFGEFYPTDAEEYRPGKGFIWCDLLYPLMHYPLPEPLSDTIARFRNAEAVLRAFPDHIEAVFAALCFRVAAEKADIIRELRARYLAKDQPYLQHLAQERIPALLEQYHQLMLTHRALWERDNKRNGWEVLALRYGAVTGRIQDVQDALRRYLNGTLETLCELDEEPLYANRAAYLNYSAFVSPSMIQ